MVFRRDGGSRRHPHKLQTYNKKEWHPKGCHFFLVHIYKEKEIKMKSQYIHLFNTDAEHDAAYTRNNSGYTEPWVSYTLENEEVSFNLPHDYSRDYLTTIARENGTISFNIWQSMGTNLITSISYSTDNGATWTTTQNQDNKQQHLKIDVNVNTGDKVLWKGTAQQTGFFDEGYHSVVGSFFSSTCEYDAEGNVMSMLYGDDFIGKDTIEKTNEFVSLFFDKYDGETECGIVNAKNLALPATTLAYGCYTSMFNGCTSLTSAPELPATTLAASCYYGMFKGCTSLTSAPVLPATTLANSCYGSMFRDCTSLTSAPELPVTTLAEGCYEFMFNGCTSLTSAPILPATTLANFCYHGMFESCTSLTSAPELPATTLVNGCYSGMFRGCTNLDYIKAMFTTAPSTTYTSNWVDGVAATGTFVKNSVATWNVTGVNGIPTGWTVQTSPS